MARIHHNVTARQRYKMVPVLDPETGQPRVTTVVNQRTGEPKTDKRGRVVTRRRSTPDKTQPLPEYTCGDCGQLIKVGTVYKHVSIKSGPYGGRTLRRHQDCRTWRPSELTTSKMAGVLAAQEAFDDFLGTDYTEEGEVEDALAQAADEIRAVAEEYRESAQNMADGFGHETSQSEELAERADELDTWADEVEGAVVPPAPEREDAEDDDEHEEAVETWRDDVREAVSIVEECPI